MKLPVQLHNGVVIARIEIDDDIKENLENFFGTDGESWIFTPIIQHSSSDHLIGFNISRHTIASRPRVLNSQERTEARLFRTLMKEE